MSQPGSSNRYRLVEQLFQSAMDLPPDQRAEFLQRGCEGDGGLFDEVHRLMRNHDAAGDYLECPVLDGGEPPDRDSTPVRIGAYSVVGRLGRGGMGVAKRGPRSGARRPHSSFRGAGYPLYSTSPNR
jgi:hypothetical protein